MDDDELENAVRSALQAEADVAVPESLVTRAAAVRHSTPRADRRTWRVRSLGGIAAAAAAVVVMAVAVSVMPSGTSPAPSGVSSAVPSSATGLANSSGPTPGMTSATSGWAVVGSGDTASGVWAPGGQRLLVIEGATNAPDADQRVLVVRADGSVERTLVGSAAVWADARSFIVWRSGRSYLESADSGAETAIDPALPLDAVSNGLGAVAVSGGLATAQETFSVWTAGRAGAPLPGVPIGWSADGTVLAVWHFRSQGHGTGTPAVGTVEFLAWPSLTRISASTGEIDWGPARFDPSGRYLAAPGPTVLDVRSGTTLARPADFANSGSQPSELVAWTADGLLVVPSLDLGPASIFDSTGRRVQKLDGHFDSASGSADGGVVVLFAFGATGEGGAVLRAGAASPFALPAGVERVSVAGERVAVETRTDTGESVLIATVP
jgi:hypothetical protein